MADDVRSEVVGWRAVGETTVADDVRSEVETVVASEAKDDDDADLRF